MGKKLTADEVAEIMRISRPALNQLHWRGEGPPRIELSARRFIYDSDSLEKYLMDRERAAAVSA